MREKIKVEQSMPARKQASNVQIFAVALCVLVDASNTAVAQAKASSLKAER